MVSRADIYNCAYYWGDISLNEAIDILKPELIQKIPTNGPFSKTFTVPVYWFESGPKIGKTKSK